MLPFLPSRSNFAHWLPWLVLAGILGTLFVENFLFSESFGVLRYREMDDLAFHTSLRQLHESLAYGRIGHFFLCYDYGYGWIFWGPVALITFPFYLLSVHAGIDWPLIVSAREISWGFGVATLKVLYSIMRHYGISRERRAAGLILLTLFPAYGYWSLRFHNNTEIMFFCALAVYFAITPSPHLRRQLLKATVATALAVATKISALIAAPIIGMLLLRRIKGLFTWSMLGELMLCLLVFVIVFFAASSPALFAAVLYPSIFSEYLNVLHSFMGNAQLAYAPFSYGENFTVGILSVRPDCSLFAVVMTSLFAGMIVTALNKGTPKDQRTDYGIMILGIAVSAAYLTATIKVAAVSVASYFTATAFLLPLGVAAFKGRNGLALLAVVTLCGLACVATSGFPGYAHLNYFSKKAAYAEKLAEAASMTDCMAALKTMPASHVMMDYKAETPINTLVYPNLCLTMIWDDFSPALNWCGRPPDFIMLSSQSSGNLPEAAFETHVQEVDPALREKYRVDRKERLAFLATHTLVGDSFAPLCTFGDVMVFKRR